jgi:hypothetical protein
LLDREPEIRVVNCNLQDRLLSFMFSFSHPQSLTLFLFLVISPTLPSSVFSPLFPSFTLFVSLSV